MGSVKPPRQKIALITGIAGQDGSYLTQFLLQKGYKVHGLLRWDSHIDPLDGISRLESLDLIQENLALHYGDITDASCITGLIKSIEPDEIYNLAALSHVQISFATPASVLDINTKGTLNILDAVRILGLQKKTRIYQASSSEMFGSSPAPQDENTPMNPCSPYGVAKLAAYHLAKIYRESYGMFIANGILFNHESPLRGEDFVTKKITRSVTAINNGQIEYMNLGNLDSIRDWGDARDYIRGMWMMLQHHKADDFVLATGNAYTVRDFVERAFACVSITIQWQGRGLDEIGVDKKTGKTRVCIDPEFFRPLEVNHLLGNTTKVRKILGWKPEIDLDTLIEDMLKVDCKIQKMNDNTCDEDDSRLA